MGLKQGLGNVVDAALQQMASPPVRFATFLTKTSRVPSRRAEVLRVNERPGGLRQMAVPSKLTT